MPPAAESLVRAAERARARAAAAWLREELKEAERVRSVAAEERMSQWR
jgi:hypothetical protein